MRLFDSESAAPEGPAIGLIVLQQDETAEQEMHRFLPASARLMVSRVPSGSDLTPETIEGMAAHLAGSAALMPEGLRFDAIGYACTSGAAQLGSERVARLIRTGAEADHATDPLEALKAACAALGLARLALLSPYVAPVSERLRAVLADAGIATPVAGSFDEVLEHRVARIAPASIRAAATDLAREGGVDALFLSCTNLPAGGLIEGLEEETGLPVLTSNQVLAWRLARLAGLGEAVAGGGRLFAH